LETRQVSIAWRRSKAALETGVIGWIGVWCIRTRFESTLPVHHVPYQTVGISVANVRYKT
jgi:hypothetical protein